jgi:hypothetical protein
LLIVINPDGSVDILVDPDQAETYDGSEDTLIGVQNNSNQIVQSIDLSSTTLDLFGFDEDGICDPENFPEEGTGDPGCAQGGFVDDAGNPAYGTTGYEGPHVVFSNINEDETAGTVSFTGAANAGGGCAGVDTSITGLAPGASAYFGLEETISQGDVNLTSAPVAKPCPTTTTTAPAEVAADTTTPGPALARTGSSTGPLLALAFLLLLVGAGLIAASRWLTDPRGAHFAV